MVLCLKTAGIISVLVERGTAASMLQVLGGSGGLWGDGVEGEFCLFKGKYFHISRAGCIHFLENFEKFRESHRRTQKSLATLPLQRWPILY